MNLWWPYEWMWASLVTAGLAIVVPWGFRRLCRAVTFLSMAAALLVFACYEWRLYRAAPADASFVQRDLLALAPLLLVAIVSCGAAVFVGSARILGTPLLRRIRKRGAERGESTTWP